MLDGVVHFRIVGASNGAFNKRVDISFLPTPLIRLGASRQSTFSLKGRRENRALLRRHARLVAVRPLSKCVNRGSLTQKKAEEDIARVIATSSKTFKALKFVVGGTVSATRRDAVEAAAVHAGITSLTIWSGVDFEEHLRLLGEDLLRRFCDGESFPDRPDELRHFASDFPGLTDNEALAQMAAVFQRPAFQTPFQEESSLPAFQAAIEDTIAALNTGVWRTREGETIRRIPSLHHLRDPQVKASVRKASELVDKLRRTFVAGLRDGTIRPCGCGNPNCPTFMLNQGIAKDLDNIRTEVLNAFRKAYHSFDVRLN